MRRQKPDAWYLQSIAGAAVWTMVALIAAITCSSYGLLNHIGICIVAIPVVLVLINLAPLVLAALGKLPPPSRHRHA
jgi:hypothetical protein